MISRAYRNYLKSPRWQKKRQEVFAFYGKRCYACRKAAKIIQVHHLSYNHIGNEPMADLMPLCLDCHRAVTRMCRRNRRKGTRRVTMEFVKAKRASLKK